MGSYDFYLPQEGITYDDFKEGGFGKSVFDKKTKELNEFLSSTPIKVRSIAANDIGDLYILMDKNIKLEVIVNSSEPNESWRFFETNGEHGIVVFEEHEDAEP